MTGSIANLNAGASTVVDAPVAVRNSGLAANSDVLVHDCDFSALKTGTDAVIGNYLTESNNQNPAG